MKFKKKLNLGCGDKYLVGWINIDNRSENDPLRVDLEIDLNKPLPFESCSVDEVLCSHILEHLDDREQVLKEIWRVLRIGGQLTVHVPHISIPVAFGHWQHKNYWSYNTILVYENLGFKVIHREIRWKLPVHPISKLVNWVSNIRPMWSERYLSKYIGGFEEVYILMEKVEDKNCEKCKQEVEHFCDTWEKMNKEDGYENLQS